MQTEEREYEFNSQFSSNQKAEVDQGPKGRLIALRFVKIMNVILVTMPMLWVWFAVQIKEINIGIATSIIVASIFIALYFWFGRIYEAFLVSYHRISEMLYSQTLSFLMADGVFILFVWVLVGKVSQVLPMMLAIPIQFVCSLAWCLCAHKWYFKRFPPRKTIVIFNERRGIDVLIQQYGLRKKFQIVDIIHVKEFLRQKELLSKVDCIFLSEMPGDVRNSVLKECIEKNITLFMLPNVGDVIMNSAYQVHLFHLPFLRVSRYNPTIEYIFLKRLVDVLVSLLFVVLLSPIMLIVAIAIKSDGGPVFYKQKRLTKNGKVYEILKFRSMRVDAEKDGIAKLATENDDRITKVGRIIRACRIDELPQLVNVLKGDMSLVGPRPERPEIASEYEKVIPEFRLRLQAKAGLTGYAQVYGKYNTTPYDKLLMDLMYIAHPSILNDLKIILATIKILFLPESTEGVDPGQVTALDYENEANRTEKWEKRDERWAD